LGRIVDEYHIGRNWTRISESGVYQSPTVGLSYPSITIQAAPGRVRLTIGGPWMPVPKRHCSPAQRKALQDAWCEGGQEDATARANAKEAIRKTYGGNRWQRHLLECARLSRALLPRYTPSRDDEQINRVTRRAATLDQFAKVVDCELSMRYAINVAYAYDAEESPAHLDCHVEYALKLDVP
jgi:hypothetical protein